MSGSKIGQTQTLPLNHGTLVQWRDVIEIAELGREIDGFTGAVEIAGK